MLDKILKIQKIDENRTARSPQTHFSLCHHPNFCNLPIIMPTPHPRFTQV